MLGALLRRRAQERFEEQVVPLRVRSETVGVIMVNDHQTLERAHRCNLRKCHAAPLADAA